MDLSLPLRSLIPSLDADVMAALAATEGALGPTQIARLTARGSRAGITKVLDRLVDHGIVTALPSNRGFMYQLNRQHLLWSALETALDVRAATVSLIKAELQTLDPRPGHASVFGSFAREEGGADSDIDLFVILPTSVDSPADAIWQDSVRSLSDAVTSATGNRLEVLALTESALHDAIVANEPIVTSLLRDSIPVWGPPLPEVLADLRVAAP